jgi:hypothetical protein
MIEPLGLIFLEAYFAALSEPQKPGLKELPRMLKGGFVGNIEDVTHYSRRQLSNSLVDFGFAAGGNDDRGAFAGRSFGCCKSET